MSYSVFYHLSDTTDLEGMNLRSEVHGGTFTLGDDEFIIEGGPGFRATYKEVIGSPQYFRIHFLCRMLEINSRKGRVFVTTPLLALFNRPLVTNFVQLMDLQAKLNPLVRLAWVRPGTHVVNG